MKLYGVLSLCVVSLVVNFQSGPVDAQWAGLGLGSGLASSAGYSSLLPATGLSLLNPFKASGPILGLVAAKLGLLGM